MFSLLLALFFVSPPSLFEEVSLSIFGQPHRFSRSLLESVGEAALSDAEQICELSRDMPPIYREADWGRESTFRKPEIYRSLLRGEGVASQALGRTHLFFVYRDGEGKVRGYIHGSIYFDNMDGVTPQALADELVVEPGRRGEGVAHVLFGRLLLEFERRGVGAVNVMSRAPQSLRFAEHFGVARRERGFPLPLAMDQLLTCDFLDRVMNVSLRSREDVAGLASQLRGVIRAAKRLDPWRTAEVFEYLAALERTMENLIREKVREWPEILRRQLEEPNPDPEEVELMARQLRDGRPFYYGIQIDRLELANLYFLMYLLHFQEREDQLRHVPWEKPAEEIEDPQALSADSLYFGFRQHFFNTAIAQMRLAQVQGGKLPAQIQIGIGRMYALLAALEKSESPEEEGRTRQWLRMSVQEYLRLFDLREVQGRRVDVMPAVKEAALKEILLERYPHKEAGQIAKKMLKGSVSLSKLFEGEEGERQREETAIAYFARLRGEVHRDLGVELCPEFGLLFMYLLPIYGLEESRKHEQVGELFAQIISGSAEREGRGTPLLRAYRIYSLSRPGPSGDFMPDEAREARLDEIWRGLERSFAGNGKSPNPVPEIVASSL